ncbi:MerR family transcriptional regulator [Risungbinella massiliensis]|uniref:MerR family transcriptional regulator n=1 Tax=Risungbinella massiliensis TaxID=1329796 RepID=UPI0005CBFD2D|nr:MerR family transcriptional regulator [Risungbinella massiliensis]
MEPQWKVGELAKLTGLTIRTLRYYDQIGLFSPSEYTEAGHRLYNQADLSRLQQILSLKELGLSLEEIRSALAETYYDPSRVISLQIARLKKNIQLQQTMLQELEHVWEMMQQNRPLTLDDFTRLLELTKKRNEKYFISWERSLDMLGDYLTE